MAPSFVVAQEKVAPAVTLTPLVRPVTGTGSGRLLIDPLPSWPLLFCPQQRTWPLSRTAQVCWAPDAIATGSITMGTSVGCVMGCIVDPEEPLALLPSCPWLLSPQQWTAPAVIAQVCDRPVAIATTFCRPGTATGCARLTWVPSPS